MRVSRGSEAAAEVPATDQVAQGAALAEEVVAAEDTESPAVEEAVAEETEAPAAEVAIAEDAGAVVGDDGEAVTAAASGE